MRNFSKTLISMAAVMAVGSAMAAGAMAADLTATYAGDKVTFSGVTAGKSQYTLLVVEGTKAEGAAEFTYDATETTIKQIDQNDAGVAFTEAVVGTLADGSYKVLVGNNDGTVDSGIFTVSSKPQVQYETIVIGDVDGDGSASLVDATLIECKDAMWDLFYETDCKSVGVERTAKDGSIIVVGDVDDDDAASLVDATLIECKDAMWDLFYETDCKNVGEEIEVVVE